MAGFFEPTKGSQTTTGVVSPAKRQAVLAILNAIAARGGHIGPPFGKGGKKGLDLDLASLIGTIQADPRSLDRTVLQSGRPAGPSTFQNLAGGVMTAGMLANLLLGDEKKSGSQTAFQWLLKQLGLGGEGSTGAGDFNLDDLSSVYGLEQGYGPTPGNEDMSIPWFEGPIY